ncbi:hypothetical protein BY457_12616 [Marinilabilia salmonicolor]|nr:hypothetical protein BY457_12616 [Marinilabilia salmonicolor]
MSGTLSVFWNQRLLGLSGARYKVYSSIVRRIIIFERRLLLPILCLIGIAITHFHVHMGEVGRGQGSLAALPSANLFSITRSLCHCEGLARSNL